MTELELEKWINKIVNRVIRRFQNYGCDRRDLISAAHVGVLEAKQRYDESKGVPFQQFAFLRVRGAVIDQIRKDFFQSVSSSKYASLLNQLEDSHSELSEKEKKAVFARAKDNALAYRVNSSDAVYFIETETVNIEERIDQFRKIKQFPEILKSLSELERQVIQKYYFKGKTFDEIASDNKKTKSAIWKVHKKAINKMRSFFDRETTLQAA